MALRTGRIDAKKIRRQLADPRELCALLGLDAKAKPQQGGGLLILCPVHREKTPSCSVTLGPDGTVRARCFSCGFTGDALHLVAVSRSMNIQTDFRAVLFEAAHLAGTNGGLAPAGPAFKFQGKPSAKLPAEKVDQILGRLLAACRVIEDAQARAYVLSRPSGPVLLEEAGRAGWGVFPAGKPGLQLAARILSELGREALPLAGLRMTPTGPAPSHPAYRLLIPFRSPTGALQTVQRRRLDDKTPRYLFPAGYRAEWPYGAENIPSMSPGTSVVYVEGAFDALERIAKYRAARADRLVLGIPGVASWRAEWAEPAQGREARVALDNDRAGEEAARCLVADLWQAGATAVHRTLPADGRKDWNSPISEAP